MTEPGRKRFPPLLALGTVRVAVPTYLVDTGCDR